MKMKKGLATVALAGVLSLGVFGTAFADTNDFTVTSAAPSLSGNIISGTSGFLAKGLGDKGDNVVIHVTYTATQNYSITTNTTTQVTDSANTGSNASTKGQQHAAVVTKTITVSSTKLGEQTVNGNADSTSSKTARTNKQSKTTGYFWNQDAIQLPTTVEIPEGAVAEGPVVYSDIQYTVDVVDTNGNVVSYDSNGDGIADTQYLKSFNF